jgi:hypothetical protein
MELARLLITKTFLDIRFADQPGPVPNTTSLEGSPIR